MASQTRNIAVAALLVILTHQVIQSEAKAMPGFFSFFSGDDDDDAGASGAKTEQVAEMILAPANATVSKGVTVTLGCKANVAVRLCRWSFYPNDDPDERKELTPFSPMSKEQKSNGRISDRDCSLRIKDVGEMHSGKWLCALMPMTHEKTWLVSKSAYLNVIDYHALAKSLATTPATTKSNANNGITLKPEPRLLLTPSTSTEPAIVPYFVIDRKADQSMDVVWILDRSVRLVDCIWITPGRHRISSKGLLSSDSAWFSPANSTCGLNIKPADAHDNSYTGTWTVRADVEDGAPIITSSLTIDPRPIIELKPNDTKVVVEKEKDIVLLFTDLSNPYPLLLLIITSLLILTLIIIVCLVAKYKKKLKDTKAKVQFQQNLQGSPSIVGIAKGMPIKTIIDNPEYADVRKKVHLELTKKDSQGSSGLKELSDLQEEESIEPESLRRTSSVIGIDMIQEKDREIVHYSHILPRYQQQDTVSSHRHSSGESSSEGPYLHMITPLPPKEFMTLPRRMNTFHTNDGYEVVQKPLPPYENTMNRQALEVLGFSSLRRDRSGINKTTSFSTFKAPMVPQSNNHENVQIVHVNGSNDCSSHNGSEDSGVDSVRFCEQYAQQI